MTATITDTIAALTAQLKAQRKGYVLPERYKPRPNLDFLDDPEWPARFIARSGVVEGYDNDAPEAVPVKAKRMVDPIAIWKRGQREGAPVKTVTAFPDGIVKTEFYEQAQRGLLDVDGERIETADELRRLI